MPSKPEIPTPELPGRPPAYVVANARPGESARSERHSQAAKPSPNSARKVDATSASELVGDELEKSARDGATTRFRKVFVAAAHRWRSFWDTRRTPAFLISLIAHTSLFLVLALWTWTGQRRMGDPFDFVAVRSQSDPQQPIEMVLATGDAPPPPSAVQAEALDTPSDASQPTTVNISDLLTPEAPVVAENSIQGELQQLRDAAAMNLSASFSSTGVEGRTLDKRRQVALARGGTIESEQAVEDALAWLAEHQLPNGAWSLVHDVGKCKGRCSHPGSPERFDTAATGLSLLAFLGAGYTHKEGKYRETVRKGVYFLLQVQEETPQGGSFLYQSDRGMYNHGIAAFALCEAYQLTGDQDLQRAAQQAIDFIVTAQNYVGGWGYLPKKPGDLTLSGWQIMALKSGFAAGLDVPTTTILKLDQFLDTQQDDSGVYYGYGKPGRSPTCTSIGHLVRLFRGRTHSDPTILDAAQYFQRVGRSNGDAYYNYYVTLFLFHVGGHIWDDWHPKVRDHLVTTQSHTGHEAGSWYFDNAYGKEGGRLYTTAMCAMTLEVYYRFSPLYQQAEVDFEL